MHVYRNHQPYFNFHNNETNLAVIHKIFSVATFVKWISIFYTKRKSNLSFFKLFHSSSLRCISKANSKANIWCSFGVSFFFLWEFCPACNHWPYFTFYCILWPATYAFLVWLTYLGMPTSGSGPVEFILSC